MRQGQEGAGGQGGAASRGQRTRLRQGQPVWASPAECLGPGLAGHEGRVQRRMGGGEVTAR